jgi:hypothetical protein
MNRAHFTDGHHSATCSGCPVCSDLAAAIVANPTNPVLVEAMGRPHLRALAERQLRTAASSTDGEWERRTTTPTLLARLGREQLQQEGLTVTPPVTASASVYASPPDGYKIALAKLKGGTVSPSAPTPAAQPLLDSADVPAVAMRPSRVFTTPPSGYAIALAKLKENGR